MESSISSSGTTLPPPLRHPFPFLLIPYNLDKVLDTVKYVLSSLRIISSDFGLKVKIFGSQNKQTNKDSQKEKTVNIPTLIKIKTENQCFGTRGVFNEITVRHSWDPTSLRFVAMVVGPTVLTSLHRTPQVEDERDRKDGVLPFPTPLLSTPG